jgi:hypothetical protein
VISALRSLAAAAIVASCLASAATASADEPEGASPRSITRPELPREYFVESHEGFDLAYHPSARERVRELGPWLSELRRQLTFDLGAPVLERVELRVAALPVEVPRLSPSPDAAVTFHGGASFPEQSLVVVSLGGVEASDETLETALRHHLAHLAIAEAAGGGAVPAWFEEGFADHFSGSRSFRRWTELELATLSGGGPTLSELDAPRRAGGHSTPREWALQHDQTVRAEALAADFVRFAAARGATAKILAGVRSGEEFDDAVAGAFGVGRPDIERAWRRDATRRYAVLPIVALAIVALLLGLAVRAMRRRAAMPRRSPARVIHRRLRPHLRRRDTKLSVPAHVADHELPRVEHGGDWHTLH